jgi:predicted dehydrogenase
MINLALIGFGSFGRTHVRAAGAMADAGRARFVAACDVKLGSYPEEEAALRARGVALYDSHDAMLAAHPEIDLVTLPLPIPLHAPLSIDCLRRGKHVLVEKPPAGTVADVRAMVAAQAESGRHCGIAFQWTVSEMFAGITRAIAAGRIGRVTEVAALCLAQRTDRYYARTGWAGKVTHNGQVVRDGTMNNPFAHQVHNLLAFAGAAEGRVARPTAVETELYAAHDIESEDTSSVRAILDNGATFSFTASLCTHVDWSIDLRITGTDGVITWSGVYDDSSPADITIDGRTEPLPIVGVAGGQEGLFANFIDVLEGRTARLACPVEESLPFAEVIEAAFTTGRRTPLHGTPYAIREAADDPADTPTYIVGIEAYARAAFEQGKLFSEVGAPWAASPSFAPPCQRLANDE